jgi:hypothetical protein
LNQPFEAIVEAIKVALCLAQTPPVHGVFGNLDQIEPGQPGKPIARQRLHRAND